MNPKLDMYFLHSLHGQIFGFHSLIRFLKPATLANTFNSKGTISHILGSQYEIISVPWKTDLTFGIAKSGFIRKL